MRVWEKTTEISERLGRQGQPMIEPGTSRLPIFSAEPLSHCWGLVNSLTSMPFPGFELGIFGVAAGFPNHYTAWSAHILLETVISVNAFSTTFPFARDLSLSSLAF